MIPEICQKDPFDIIAMAPRGTLGLCCIHIAQLMTHPAIYTLPSALQLCYKLLGILQRVTKTQKVHISSPNGLKKLHNINFAWLRPQSFLERKHSSRNFPFPNQIFWTKNIPLWLTKRIFSKDLKKQIVDIFKNWTMFTRMPQPFTSIHNNLSHSNKNLVSMLLCHLLSSKK